MDQEAKESLLRKVLSKWGLNSELDVSIEECSELIQAICKLRRYGETEKTVTNLIEEIADVSIICDQLSLIYGKDKVKKQKDIKLERLKQRLNQF